MIEVVISNNCRFCSLQLENMNKSFFTDEYRIINVDSEEFKNYDQNVQVDAVPFVVVRDENGTVKYAQPGVHDGTELRKIERRSPVEPFNLRRVKASR